MGKTLVGAIESGRGFQLTHIQKPNAALGSLTPEKMANPRQGEVFLVERGDRRRIHQKRGEDPLPPGRSADKGNGLRARSSVPLFRYT